MAKPEALKRTKIIKVRFNRSELDHLHGLAGDSPLAPYARRTLLNQSISPGIKHRSKASSTPPANANLVRQIAYIGNNLNQIALRLNTQLKNHPSEAINTLVLAHILQLIWERVDALQNF